MVCVTGKYVFLLSPRKDIGHPRPQELGLDSHAQDDVIPIPLPPFRSVFPLSK